MRLCWADGYDTAVRASRDLPPQSRLDTNVRQLPERRTCMAWQAGNASCCNLLLQVGGCSTGRSCSGNMQQQMAEPEQAGLPGCSLTGWNCWRTAGSSSRTAAAPAPRLQNGRPRRHHCTAPLPAGGACRAVTIRVEGGQGPEVALLSEWYKPPRHSI